MKKCIGSLLCASMLLSVGVAQSAILTNDNAIVSADVEGDSYDSGEFIFKITNDSAEIIGLSKTNMNSKNIVIPSTISDKNQKIQGLPVKVIGSRAFEKNEVNQKGLESVKFASPSNVEVIDFNAFKDNDLSEIQFPKSLKKINDSAFMNNHLTSLSIPEKLELLGPNSFYGNKIVNLLNYKSSLFPENFFGLGTQLLDDVVNESAENQEVEIGKNLNMGNGTIKITSAKIDGANAPISDNKITVEESDRDLKVSYEYVINDKSIINYYQRFFFPRHGKYQTLKNLIDKTNEKLKNNNYEDHSKAVVETYISCIEKYFKGEELSIVQQMLPYSPEIVSEQDLIDNFERVINDLVPINSNSNSGSNSGTSTPSTPTENPSIKDFDGVLQVMATKGTTIYKDANLTNKTDRVLDKDSRWRVFGVKKVKGNTIAYNLGGNQWVKADDVLITEGQEIKPNKIIPMSGIFVIKVPNKPTWSTVVWRENLSTTNKYLKPRTAWKVFGKKTIKGNLYYNLGGDQWVCGKYGFLR